MTIETPTRSGVACDPVTPATVIMIPAPIPMAPRSHRRRLRRLTGSGRLRIAATRFSRLTRHADTVTTISVSTTPSEYASRMLRALDREPEIDALRAECRSQDMHHAERR